VRGPIDIRFQRSAGTLSRRVGASVLVTRIDASDVQELSGGASAVWADLATPRTVPALVERLAVAHGTEPGDIAEDVGSCIDMLVNLGVVEEVQDFDG
jgi:hypothetical protein